MLDAFVAAVASRGYEAITLRSIAVETGMSPARLSYHFGTKKKLFLAALEHVEDRAAGNVVRSTKGARTHWQRVAKVIGESIPSGVGDPEWQIWLAAFDQAPYDSDVEAVLEWSARRFKATLASVIQAGADAGDSLLGRHAVEAPRGGIFGSALAVGLAPDFGFTGAFAAEFVGVADLRSAVRTVHLFPLFGEYGSVGAEVPAIRSREFLQLQHRTTMIF